MASALEDLKARMLGFDDIATDLRMMIYGDSGQGKTIFAMQMAQAITPAGRGILFLDARNGWVSLSNPEHETLRARTKRLRVYDLRELSGIAEWIRDGVDIFGFISTVVIDEASTFASDDLAHVYNKNRGIPDGAIPEDVPEYKDYKQALARYRAILDLYESIDGLSIIQVSHQREDKIEDKIKLSPKFNPELGKSVRESQHVVAYLTSKLVTRVNDVENEAQFERTLQVHPSPLVVAKSRIGGLPARVSPEYLIDATVDWLGDPEQMIADQKASGGTTLAKDQTNTEPYDETGVNPDDEPAYSE